MNYPRCGGCAFSASFVTDRLMLVSYVAGEGVELTVHKESVVVEEIKEGELRFRRAQFIYDRTYNRIGLQPRGHAPSRLPVMKLRCLLHKSKKVRVFVWKGIQKNIISYYSSSLNFIGLLRVVFSSQQRLNRPAVNVVQRRHHYPKTG